MTPKKKIPAAIMRRRKEANRLRRLAGIEERPIERRNKTPELDELNALYERVGPYIEKIGGTAVVVGGTQIMRWPSDPEFKYSLVIQIVGKRPGKKDGE